MTDRRSSWGTSFRLLYFQQGKAAPPLWNNTGYSTVVQARLLWGCQELKLACEGLRLAFEKGVFLEECNRKFHGYLRTDNKAQPASERLGSQGTHSPVVCQAWSFGFLLLCFPVLLKMGFYSLTWFLLLHDFMIYMISACIWAKIISCIEISYLLKKKKNIYIF